MSWLSPSARSRLWFASLCLICVLMILWAADKVQERRRAAVAAIEAHAAAHQRINERLDRIEAELCRIDPELEWCDD